MMPIDDNDEDESGFWLRDLILNFSHHNKETLLITLDPHYGNLH